MTKVITILEILPSKSILGAITNGNCKHNSRSTFE